jgi:hypothetical protein
MSRTKHEMIRIAEKAVERLWNAGRQRSELIRCDVSTHQNGGTTTWNPATTGNHLARIRLRGKSGL